MTGVQIMVVAIVALAMVASLLKARMHSAAPRDSEDTLRMREELKALRDRVAVLERIATENQNSLAHEIERLRDR